MNKTSKPLIVGNWKLTPATFTEAKSRYEGIKKAASKYSMIQVVVCPPASYIGAFTASKSKAKKVLGMGAQNVSVWTEGSKTGEIAASMVKSVGAEFAIVGHSERRAMGETDEIVAEKTAEVMKTGMTAVVCVGEHERDEQGEYLEVIKTQLKKSLSRVARNDTGDLVIAYEPVWAIGRKDNVAITSHDLHQMSIFIRKTLKEMFGPASDLIRIIYGGSVTPENAYDLYVNGDIVGFLPGRSSWDAKTFEGIFAAVSEALKTKKKQQTQKAARESGKTNK